MKPSSLTAVPPSLKLGTLVLVYDCFAVRKVNVVFLGCILIDLGVFAQPERKGAGCLSVVQAQVGALIKLQVACLPHHFLLPLFLSSANNFVLADGRRE